MIKVYAPEKVADPDALRNLLQDYLEVEVAAYNDMSGDKLDHKDFVDDLMSSLPGFLPPYGRIFLAEDAHGSLFGTVFLKPLSATRFEIKTLYVTPATRGQGLAKTLIQTLETTARDMGAAALLLDVGKYLPAACGLYATLGYRKIPRYPENSNPESFAPFLWFMQKDLL